MVRPLTDGDRDREEILDQPFDVGLPATVTALPRRHHLLDLTITKVKKVDVLVVRGFALSSLQHNRLRASRHEPG